MKVPLTFFIQYHTGHKIGKRGNLGLQTGNRASRKQAQSSAWRLIVAPAVPDACNVLLRYHRGLLLPGLLDNVSRSLSERGSPHLLMQVTLPLPPSHRPQVLAVPKSSAGCGVLVL